MLESIMNLAILISEYINMYIFHLLTKNQQ